MDEPALHSIALPLTIKAFQSAYVIRDATGLLIAHVNFDTDAGLARTRQMPLPDEALALAKVIARAVTAAGS